MSRLVSELETVLQNLLAEHRKMLAYVEAHESAIRAIDLKAMDVCLGQQEAGRLRINALDNQRKSIVMQLARTMRIEPAQGNVTLARLAELHPPRRDALLKLRDDLRQVAAAISDKNKVSGRVARAVLGHLNFAMRLLSGAVERAGVYTRQGVPRPARRIGVMEAVG